MENWQLLLMANQASRQQRLARAARVQAESVARVREAEEKRRDGGYLYRLFHQPPLAA
jgi:hypothetical protein